MEVKERFVWVGLTLSLILNVWGISKWISKADAAQPNEGPRKGRAVFNPALPKVTTLESPHSKRSKQSKQSKLDVIERPRDGHVWSDPVVLTNFLKLSSNGECRIEPELKDLLRLDEAQAKSLEQRLIKAVASVVTDEKASAKIVETDDESFVEIPAISTDVAGTVIGEVSPPLNPQQRSLLESVLRASAWFRELSQARVLALEEDSGGALYFDWQGALYHINDKDRSSNRGAWAEFSDRFHHLVNFEALLSEPETPK